jgi:predicted transcriptional regulator
MQEATQTNQAELKMIGDIVASYAASNPSATPASVAEMVETLKKTMATPAAAVASAPQAEIPSQAPEAPAQPEAATEENVETKTAKAEKPKPAVPINKSFSKDKVTCLCCGKQMSMLKRHLGAAHGLSPEEYKEMFNLPEDHPITAPSYTMQKRSMAEMTSFGKYPRKERKTEKAK